ncbi:TPA: hypothetical protein N0F65_010790 [Lagenidium giganteum]|uniref:Phosphatidylethanolamine-binding protein n=1 Tax=Lagenidium giganteum TaxID=4803 RepID=A0AAV2YVL3_9STRA|nr:TPA: hypothetical protein N0F65_010790 [Lagenidium giganteum]
MRPPYTPKRYTDPSSSPLLHPPSATASRALLWKILAAFVGSALVMGLLVQSTAVSGSLEFVDDHVASTSTQQAVALAAAMPAGDDDGDDDDNVGADTAILLDILDRLEKDDDDEDATITISYLGDRVADEQYVPMKNAATPPSVEITGQRHQYTWILIDVSAPNATHPTHAPWLHYLVANLDPEQPDQQQIEVPYYPATPPFGDHQYVSLLLSQDDTEPENEASDDEDWSANRSKFDVVGYAEDHGLRYVSHTTFISNPSEPN